MKVMATLFGAGITMGAGSLGQLKLAPESTVWVSGNSTVKDFRCAAKAFDADVASPSAETMNLDVAKLVSSADIAIDVQKLDCGNGTMNEHMRKALNEKQYPRIDFKMTSYEIANGVVTVNGALTVNGQTHPVALVGKVAEQNGVVHSDASKQIDMTQWGVKPPSLMLGTMKVKPVVTIGYDITIKR